MTDYSRRYAQAGDKLHYVRIAGCYQSVKDCIIQTDFRPDEDIIYERTPGMGDGIHLLKDGRLFVAAGYCWDGVSGPVKDRKANMRGGFFHDALYHLMRMMLLDYRLWSEADKEYAKLLKEDGAWPLTIWADLKGLRTPILARGRAAHPKQRRKVKKAP
jgi:hypothetical protein